MPIRGGIHGPVEDTRQTDVNLVKPSSSWARTVVGSCGLPQDWDAGIVPHLDRCAQR